MIGVNDRMIEGVSLLIHQACSVLLKGNSIYNTNGTNQTDISHSFIIPPTSPDNIQNIPPPSFGVDYRYADKIMLVE